MMNVVMVSKVMLLMLLHRMINLVSDAADLLRRERGRNQINVDVEILMRRRRLMGIVAAAGAWIVDWLLIERRRRIRRTGIHSSRSSGGSIHLIVGQ